MILPSPSTEARNPRTAAIDRCDTLGVLQLLQAEDATVAEIVRGALPQLALAVEAALAALRAQGRLIYVGAGTSGRLGVLDAVECVPTFGVEPWQVVGLIAGGAEALVRSVEGAEDDAEAGRRDLEALGPTGRDFVVGLAASGRTPYVLAALEAARDAEARTAAIACNRPSPLLEAAEIAIPLVVGPEAITGSTRLKAGTAQKMALNLLSTATMIRLGKVYGNLMVDVRVTNHKLVQRAVRIVSEVTGVEATEAARLLAETDWRVKPAIVMALLGLTAPEADARLQAAGGLLAQVIGPARSP
jgi:N-acetylmuramic acid 6-phosphate etherase